MPIPTIDWLFDRNGRHSPSPLYILEVRPRLDPDAAPIAWLIVERVESVRLYDPPHDNSIAEASITLNYRRLVARHDRHILKKAGSFCGAYQRFDNRVSLTSPTLGTGAVFLDLHGLEGNRIGTYFMNQVVSWCRRWPYAEVATITLDAHQATADNKARRNRFYEQFGIKFVYSDVSCSAGHSKPMLAKDLTPMSSWAKNITEHQLEEYISDLIERRQDAERDVDRLQCRVDAQKKHLDEINAAPFRGSKPKPPKFPSPVRAITRQVA